MTPWLFVRRRARNVRWTLGLTALLVLGGCIGSPVPDSLFLYVETDSKLNPHVKLGDSEAAARKLINEFRQVNPGVNIHVRHLPSEAFLGSTAYRTARGLGPDLLVTRVVTALQLHRRGLTEAVHLDPVQLQQINPRFLDDFRAGPKLLAVPLLAQPEVACYNRRRLPVPPRSLDELVGLSAKGLRVGLSLRMEELFWTSSGMGADDALLRLLGEPAGPGGSLAIQEADREAMLRWLNWLNNANLQQNVQFSEDAMDLVERLEQGRLDWISCNSLWLERLGNKLGPDLGVSELPGRDGRPAETFIHLKVWSFGQHSTPRQRRIAEQFVLFTLNKLNQKRLLLAAPGNLPVNREVLIPTKSSAMFAALAASLERSRVLHYKESELIETRLAWADDILQHAIVGGSRPAEVLRRFQQGPPRDGNPGPGGL